jgi:hypothetical protein
MLSLEFGTKVIFQLGRPVGSPVIKEPSSGQSPATFMVAGGEGKSNFVVSGEELFFVPHHIEDGLPTWLGRNQARLSSRVDELK